MQDHPIKHKEKYNIIQKLIHKLQKIIIFRFNLIIMIHIETILFMIRKILTLLTQDNQEDDQPINTYKQSREILIILPNILSIEHQSINHSSKI